MLDLFTEYAVTQNLLALALATVVGLAGSLHCVGMCGGLVTACGSSGKNILVYQLGRLLGYLFLGLMAGLVGEYVIKQYSSQLHGFFTWFFVAFFLFLGIRVLLKNPLRFRMPKLLQQLWFRFAGKRGGMGAFATGALSIFLPCGLLYAVALTSVSFQSLGIGLLTMFFFWLGTVPAMSFAPYLVRRIFSPVAQKYPWLSGAFFISLALGTVFWRYYAMSGSMQNCH